MHKIYKWDIFQTKCIFQHIFVALNSFQNVDRKDWFDKVGRNNADLCVWTQMASYSRFELILNSWNDCTIDLRGNPHSFTILKGGLYGDVVLSKYCLRFSFNKAITLSDTQPYPPTCTHWHTHTWFLLSINLCFSPARGREPLSVFQCMDILLINLVDSMIRLCCLPGRSGWQIEIFGDNFAQITNCLSIFIFILVPKPQKASVCSKQAKTHLKKSLKMVYTYYSIKIIF